MGIHCQATLCINTNNFSITIDYIYIVRMFFINNFPGNGKTKGSGYYKLPFAMIIMDEKF